MNKTSANAILAGLLLLFAAAWLYAIAVGSGQAATVYFLVGATLVTGLAIVNFKKVLAILGAIRESIIARRERRVQQRERAEAAREGMRRQLESDGVNREVMYLRSCAAPHLMLGLDPVEFERFVLRYFRILGFDTQETEVTGDGGIDGILRRGHQVFLIQCKRYAGNTIGEPPIRDLLGAMTKACAHGGFFITTSSFTTTAVEFAQGTGITLLDGETFSARLRSLPLRVPAGFCQVCGDDLRGRNGSCPNCGTKKRTPVPASM